ncbi:C-terminal dimerization related protein, partial [Dacryopinax primogenitus]
GLKGHVMHRDAGGVDTTKVEEARIELRKLMDQYALQDIFNMDETGLYGKMPPNRTLTTQQIHGRKDNKDRLSYAFTVNADGSEYIDPLVIGKSCWPRSF